MEHQTILAMWSRQIVENVIDRCRVMSSITRGGSARLPRG